MPHRVEAAVRGWRRGITQLAYEGARSGVDPEAVAALLATVLLGGRRGAGADERLAGAVGVQRALRLRERGRAELEAATGGLLAGERELRLGSLDALDVTARQQAGLIAALSVLQRER
jgi:hypothetical protein